MLNAQHNHIDIILYEKIYHPGDSLNGEILFNLDRKMFCDLIKVQIYGSARVFWTEKQMENGQYRSVGFEQKRVLVDDTLIIWKDDCSMTKNGYDEHDDKPKQPELQLDDIVRYALSTTIRSQKLDKSAGLDPGKHKFNFSFDLPKTGLHTSFDVPGCPASVRYYIIVQCMSHFQLISKKKLLFALVCEVNLNENNAAIGGQQLNKRIPCSKNGYIDIGFDITKQGVTPGAAIPARIFIDNKSARSIKYSHLSVMQHVSCFATFPIPCCNDFILETPGVGLPVDKIHSGTSYKYIPRYNIPAFIPNFTIDGCIKLEYILKLDIGFHRKCAPNEVICSLKAPLFVGTVPVDEMYSENHECAAPNLGKVVRVLRHSQNFDTDVPLVPRAKGSPPPPYCETLNDNDVDNGNGVDDDDCDDCCNECPRYSKIDINHKAKL